MQKQYIVRLSADERHHLQSVIKKLSGSSQKVRRAQILLKADFEANNDAPFARYDVAELKADDLDSMFMPGMPKVLIGSAPCQPFST